MQELFNRLQSEAGLTPEKAKLSVDVVKNFVKERFPMFADAIDKLFEEDETKDDFLE